MNKPSAEKRDLIEKGHATLSITKQCELLSLSKGGLYYEPVPIDAYNLLLMDLIDREYLAHPFYGGKKMVIILEKLGHHVNVKRVRRLMRLMGIKAIYPQKKLSIPANNHPRYPYLLKGLAIDHPDHVWCSDITYLRIGSGFAYLTAVMDWFSRYVLSWRLSNCLLADFCIEALHDAFNHGTPEIFNIDQGSQYTSTDFLSSLTSRHIKVSMDSRGRYFDNIMIERLWRTVKYEEVYLKEYTSIREARESLKSYFTFYNERRIHQSLSYKTPAEMYKLREEVKEKGSKINHEPDGEKTLQSLTKKS